VKISPEKLFGRPLHFLVAVLAVLFVFQAGLYIHGRRHLDGRGHQADLLDIVTSSLGLTDLCIATEARYTRHPAVSDPMVPFMDHPGALEHFPTGSFWVPQGSTLPGEGM